MTAAEGIGSVSTHLSAHSSTSKQALRAQAASDLVLGIRGMTLLSLPLGQALACQCLTI